MMCISVGGDNIRMRVCASHAGRCVRGGACSNEKSALLSISSFETKKHAVPFRSSNIVREIASSWAINEEKTPPIATKYNEHSCQKFRVVFKYLFPFSSPVSSSSPHPSSKTPRRIFFDKTREKTLGRNSTLTPPSLIDVQEI